MVSYSSPKHSPRHGSMTSERLSKLSPAAQKLVKSSVRINTDKSLKASYSPSPAHLKRSPFTPKGRTPGSNRSTRLTTPGSRRIESSITDNLLQLPKT